VGVRETGEEGKRGRKGNWEERETGKKGKLGRKGNTEAQRAQRRGERRGGEKL
jgi:hypothetical protein